MAKDDSKFLDRKGEARYDPSCPYYKSFWDDLLDCSPFYDRYCVLSFHVDIAGSDYDFCDQENHFNCPLYLNEIAKKQKELANLEGAD